MPSTSEGVGLLNGMVAWNPEEFGPLTGSRLGGGSYKPENVMTIPQSAARTGTSKPTNQLAVVLTGRCKESVEEAAEEIKKERAEELNEKAAEKVKKEAAEELCMHRVRCWKKGKRRVARVRLTNKEMNKTHGWRFDQKSRTTSSAESTLDTMVSRSHSFPFSIIGGPVADSHLETPRQLPVDCLGPWGKSGWTVQRKKRWPLRSYRSLRKTMAWKWTGCQRENIKDDHEGTPLEVGMITNLLKEGEGRYIVVGISEFDRIWDKIGTETIPLPGRPEVERLRGLSSH
ncbi:hypothetical protein F5890DRAFT_1654915 [Lentinula detonsa]|uniref:Uncharacterized protein n=1 Tax=Lentinula detonsa TaxID=2804962 RepID=A0AA38PN50_9AGAR|nr:hypothetical protein F5890DRAFT_1654915 [Lentinula detonsa]